eukprot:TRINITY_DN1002_c0_g2_i1.p1 TRINITY_DN1002_c0_g2~~TRINITY_DN1002_c0_g2_i1.p1  ORF type:complete len:182 (-),score=56.80 TRINITY_DN1002_c0_g2_i1:39-584(-)
MQRFIANRFLSEYRATIGADFASKDLIIEDKAVSLQVWDTAGQERYQSLGVAFYKGAECCMLVYDITNPRSFASLDNWRCEFLRHAAPRNPSAFPFIVLGNKADKEDTRKVPAEKVKVWCENNGQLPFYETSAKMQTNVVEAFEEATRRILKNKDYTQLTPPSSKKNHKLKAFKTKENNCC